MALLSDLKIRRLGQSDLITKFHTKPVCHHAAFA
jgi:hypothetical protein